jgi:hypothetical protein
MKVFPEWMYRDPADAASILEGIEVRAEKRARQREKEQVREAKESQRVFFARLQLGLKRTIAAPPEVQIKRARIRALVRQALKERR